VAGHSALHGEVKSTPFYSPWVREGTTRNTLEIMLKYLKMNENEENVTRPTGVAKATVCSVGNL
jgi:hypothetical protein